MNTKPKNLRQIFSAAIVVILLAIFVGSFTIPRPLKKIAPEFDPEAVTNCDIFCYGSEVSPPLTVTYTSYTFSIDPNSEEYDEFTELLSSTKYRKKFSNIVSSRTHKIPLDIDAFIPLKTPDSCFEFRLYGPEMSIGFVQDRNDYVPSGGEEFQQSVVDFIFENATLVKQETSRMQRTASWNSYS